MKTKSAIFLVFATQLVAASLAFSLGTTAGHRRASSSPLVTSIQSFSLNSVPNNDKQDDGGDDLPLLPDRRQWFQHQAALIASACVTSVLPTPAALATSGLLVFPVSPQTQLLKNRYHFMRAGISELEMDGIYSTNALFLTNRENQMHPSAEKVLLESLKKLKTETDGFPTILYHSLAANGMDTGDFIARQLSLGREKTLPEFTYLDQRGVGLWDSGDEKLVKPAIWALDHEEAGKLGMTGRPPNNDDGTAAETLNDQFIRLRQFLSLQESRTTGDNILVIFPDGTGPALLSCMIAGIPYKDVHALEFAPGEIRLDISPESVQALFEQKKNDPTYLATLEDGKQKLKALREDDVFVNLKEQRLDNDNMEMDAEFNKKRLAAERERMQKEAEERVMREKERVMQAEANAKAREERERQRLERLEADKRLQEERDQQRKAQMAAAREKERQRRQSQQSDSAMAQSTEQDSSSPLSMLPVAATGIVGLGMAAAVGSMMGTNDTGNIPVETTKKELEPILNATESAATITESTIDEKVPAIVDLAESLTPEESASNDILVVDSINTTTTTTFYPPTPQKEEDDDVITSPVPPVSVDEATTQEIKEQLNAESTNDNDDTEDLDSVNVAGAGSDEVIEDQLSQLAEQEQPSNDNDDTEDLDSVNVAGASSDEVIEDQLSQLAEQEQPSNDIGDTEDLDSVDAVGVSSDEVIEDQLSQLASQEQALKDALYESTGSVALTPPTSNDDSSSGEVDDFLDGLDSFDSDWLQLMQDIQNEEEEVEEYEESFELLPLNGDTSTTTLLDDNKNNTTTWGS